MKAVVVHKFCDTLDQLQVSEVPKPSPKPDELFVQIVAAGVNFVDTLYARGKHQNNRSLVKPPFTLGLEFAGIVISAPPSSPFQPEDGIFGDYNGCYTEYVSLPLSSATRATFQKVPRSWSFVEAAGLGATLPVSYGALVLGAKVKSGETVLIHAAAGGLGIMAVQIAAVLGCRVIGTAGSDTKCDYARSHGAEECINYSKGNWWERVLRLTGGKGADVVFDSVGLVDLSLKCIAHRGRVLVVGFAAREGQMEKVAMNRVLLKQVTIIGYRYGETVRRYPEEKSLIWRRLTHLLGNGKINPTTSRCYDGLESIPRALEDLSNRRVLGKAVIKVRDSSMPRL